MYVCGIQYNVLIYVYVLFDMSIYLDLFVFYWHSWALQETFIKRYAYLFERQNIIERERERNTQIFIFHPLLHGPNSGLKARVRNSSQVSSMAGCQNSKHLAYHYHRTGLETSQLEAGSLIFYARSTSYGIMHCKTTPALTECICRLL